MANILVWNLPFCRFSNSVLEHENERGLFEQVLKIPTACHLRTNQGYLTTQTRASDLTRIQA